MKKSKSAKSALEKVPAAKTEHDFLTVGIGASAGGIKALKEFFAAMPADSGMAFVVILHLSQTHESSLAHILQNETAMRVEQVTETVKVEPNNVYVIPPAKGLAMVDGHIKLTEPTRVKGQRVPIDLFFRTLADAYGKNGIAVVLSGTGSDGTLGLKRVKENGGIGIAQNPDEAEYDGMPRSAIDTGLVDLILPVGEMPAKIIGLRDAGERINLPKEKDAIPPSAKGKQPDALNEILAIVRVRTGHDFSTYKHATVLRRIARRLQVHEFEEMPEYLAYLRENPDEAAVLQRDLLITVTNFFRDKAAFAVLEKEVVPKLFAGKTAADTVRVWSVACATGEEAYSLAMLLDEYASGITNAPKIQVFASDINEDAIAAGRECFYEEPIVADVSPERLRRFFAKENGGWRVRKDLRETVLFTTHNILRDPPLSKLDLIVCRNLLIYFNRETQEKVLAIFNFALRRDGFLFLGASESAESSSALFSVLDKKHRLYRARPATQFQPMLPAPGGWNPRIPQLPIEKGEESPPPSYGEIHYQLVEQFAPPSVLVSEDYEILHVSEHAGRFLRVTVGEPTRNLLKVVNPALKLDLQSALFEAKKNGAVGESRNVRFNLGFGNADLGFEEINSQSQTSKLKSRNQKTKIRSPKSAETLVNITVRLLQKPDAADTFYLVVFDESKSAAAPDKAGQTAQTIAGRDAVDGIVGQLENELRISRERLRATIEQNETSSEELKASNEELQAINEELRSTSEELETGKEELQSLNEELTTVNHELKDKVDETLHLNSDLQNLIQSTDIGTIFLDRALQVRSYTPRVTEIFNIIPSDIGRPLEHITHQLKSDHLADDAGEVLQTLHLKEREMRGGADDSRYLVRIAPYRTLEDKIDGVVLSFQDITDLKRASDAMIAAEERFRLLIESAKEYAIFTTDLERRVNSWNVGAETMFGYTAEEILGQDAAILFTPANRAAGEVEREVETATAEGRAANERWHIRQDGSRFYGSGSVMTLRDEGGQLLGFTKIMRDLTEQRQIEEALRVSEEKYHSLFDSIDEGFCIVEVLFDEQEKAADYRFLEMNPVFERQSGLENARGKTILELVPDLEPQWVETYGQVTRTGEAVRFEADVAPMNRVFDIYAFPANAPDTVAVLFTDITERKRAEQVLREKDAELEAIISETPFMLARCTRDFRYRYVSRAYAEMFHRAPEEINGKSIIEMVGEKNWKTVALHVERVLQGERVEFETEVDFRGAGEPFFLHVAYTPDTDEHGEVVGWFASIVDVTERKLAEIALRESEERLRTLIENLPGGAVFVLDREMRYLVAEGEAPAAAGFAPADLVGRTIQEAMPTEIAADYEPRFRNALTGKKFDHEHEAHGRTFVSRGLPLADAAGEIYAVLAVSYDITRRKQAEESLRESEERLRLAVEAGELGTWDWNLATGEVFWNERHFTLFGMLPRPNPLLAEEFFRHIHPEDAERVRGQLENAVSDKTIFRTEFRAVTEAGETRWMGGYGQTVETDASGKTVRMSGVMFDVTESKRAEDVQREKETLQKMVGAQEDERRRIAQDLHDHLGQQLTALRLKIESIKIMCDGDEALCERVDETQAIAQQIDADIDFLAWEMRPSALDDIGLAAALANFVGEWSKHFNVQADFQARRFGKNRLAPDAETHLYRIAQEALNNVFKHAQATNVDVSLERRDGYAVLIVEDDGIGFAPDKVSGKKDAKRIGLSGMKERAALVGGKVEIESAPGKGTTLFVRVPVSNSEKPKKGKKKKDE